MVMQPFIRIVRLRFDSTSAFITPRSLRIIPTRSARPSICLQCRISPQVRRFADSTKSSLPSTTAPPSNTEASTSDSKPSARNPEAEAPISHTDEIHPNLPSAQEGRRLEVSRRFSRLMDHLQGNIFVASQRINDLTGYSGIEALKERISRLEQRVEDGQEAVRSARNTYKTTVADRAATQREVTGLLARKDTWNPTDLERFTTLYRMDHSNEQAVQEAVTRLADAEREAEHSASRLSSSILSRYHEEQIWSDKIRRMSTWGTWGLMGVNVLLFLVFQFGFEPWRRKRLVLGFEEKVREALDKERVSRHQFTSGAEKVSLNGMVATGLQELEAEMDNTGISQEPAIAAVAACIEGESGEEETSDLEVEAALDTAELHVPTFMMKLRKSEPWTFVEDLFSSRVVQMKRQDVTIIALEGAAIGTVMVTVIATLLLRPS